MSKKKKAPQSKKQPSSAKAATKEHIDITTHEAYLRLYAAFENYKKRRIRERDRDIAQVSKQWAQGLIAVCDDFELIMLHLNDGKDELAESIRLTHKKFAKHLQNQGLEAVAAKAGSGFDDTCHEAIATKPAQKPAYRNTIASVTRKGYRLGDQVIRFAEVVVYM